MPILDNKSSPTIDMAAEAAVPLHREEPYQLQAQPAPTLRLATKSRPLTHKMVHDLVGGRIPVRVRQSNINPDNAGEEAVSSMWALSDPQLAADVDPAAESPAPGGLGISVGALGIGVAIGLGLWWMGSRW